VVGYRAKFGCSSSNGMIWVRHLPCGTSSAGTRGVKA